MNSTFKMTLMGAALVIVSATSFAADVTGITDMGTTKSETVTVKMNVPKLVNIAKPNDFNLTFNGAENPTDTQSFCIASNMGPDATVKLTLTDNSVTEKKSVTGYKMVNTDASKKDHNTVAFKVFYVTNGKETAMEYGKVTDVSGAKWLNDCNGGAKASALKVDVAKSDALNVYNGEYSTVLKMTVAAE